MQRPKLNFPYENGFIQLNPSLAAEIGRDPAIVFMYFVFMLEGNTKFLLWDIESQSYWVRKSLNKITYDLFPYFKIEYSTKKNETIDNIVSFDGVKSRIRRLMDFLVNGISLLNKKLFSSPETYYSINYEMCSALNGITVKWDFDPDHSRRKLITSKKDVRQLALNLGVSVGHPLDTVSSENPVTHPKAVSGGHSTVSPVTPYIYNIKKENKINIERESQPAIKPQIPNEVRELVNEAFN